MNTDRLLVAFGIGAALLMTVPVVSQERRQAGNPAVAARPWPPERLSDGQPNVQGMWAAVNAGSVSLTNPISVAQDFDQRVTGVEARRPRRVIDPPDGLLPYLPWAAARQQQQAKAYDKGYFYPGPAVKDVTLDMAPQESKDALAKFGRPEYEQLIANNPKETSLPAQQQVAAFQKWDREIGSGKTK